MGKHVNDTLSLLFDLDLNIIIHDTFEFDLFCGGYICFNDVNILFLILFKTMCFRIAHVAQS